MNIEIIIADDHSMIREGIKQLLELDDNLKIVGFADNGKEAVSMVENLKPNILLLDINMPVLNGIEALSEIKKKKLNVGIIILTIHNEIEYLIKAIELGCDGYILKEYNSTELKKAIYSVSKGKKYIQLSMTPLLNNYLTKKSDADAKLAELTNREIQVLKLIAEGLFNKEIASRLNISERTVKNHISNIFKKIDVSDRTQAAVFAIKNELVNL